MRKGSPLLHWAAWLALLGVAIWLIATLDKSVRFSPIRPWGRFEVAPSLLLLTIFLTVLVVSILLASPPHPRLHIGRSAFRTVCFLGVSAGIVVALLGYVHTTMLAAALKSGDVGHSSDYLGVTENLLALFGVILGLGALSMTVFGFWIQSKLNSLSELEDLKNEISELAVVAAESALIRLPPPSQTQQVPARVLEMLETLVGLVFDDPERIVGKYLERVQDGARLHLARAIYAYGTGNNSLACAELEETLNRAGKDDLRRDAMAWQAIVQRQVGDIVKSHAIFEQLYREAIRHDLVARQSQALVGEAICYLKSHDADLLDPAKLLESMQQLEPSTHDDPMLWMYFLKIYHSISDPKWQRRPRVSPHRYKDELEKSAKRLDAWLDNALKDPDVDANLKANYLYSRFWLQCFCCTYLNHIPEKGSEMTCRLFPESSRGYLKSSKDLASSYAGSSNVRRYIYSELCEELIPVQKFCRELDEYSSIVESANEKVTPFQTNHPESQGIKAIWETLMTPLWQPGVSVKAVQTVIFDSLRVHCWDQLYTTDGQRYGSSPSTCARRLLARLSDLSEECEVLELGCGHGRDAIWLLKKHATLKITAIDSSPTAIASFRSQLERSKHKLRARTEIEDIPSWNPLWQEHFDVLFANAFWHLFLNVDREKLFDLASRLLKPGGELIASFMSTRDAKRGRNCEVELFTFSCYPDRPWHWIHFFSKEELRSILTDYGFRVDCLEEQTEREMISGREEDSIYWQLIAKKQPQA